MANKILKVSESAVRAGIKAWARFMGWGYIWNLQGLGCMRGMADITLVKGGVTLWVEAKAPGKKQSPAQVDFEQFIKAHGGHYVLAYSFLDIEAYLASIQKKAT